jgi:hypothetical protein
LFQQIITRNIYSYIIENIIEHKCSIFHQKDFQELLGEKEMFSDFREFKAIKL